MQLIWLQRCQETLSISSNLSTPFFSSLLHSLNTFRCSEKHGLNDGTNPSQQVKCTSVRDVQYLNNLYCTGKMIFKILNSSPIESFTALLCEDEPQLDSASTTTNYDNTTPVSRTYLSVYNKTCRSGYAMVTSNYNSYTLMDHAQCLRTQSSGFK